MTYLGQISVLTVLLIALAWVCWEIRKEGLPEDRQARRCAGGIHTVDDLPGIGEGVACTACGQILIPRPLRIEETA